jgi:hypothetical protein
MKYETALEDLKEELKPFFEDLETDGFSIFETSRVWNVARDLELDDNSFQMELFDYLQETYNCEILTHSTDMGSFVVLHDTYYLDENGNCYKKPVEPTNEDSFLDDRFEDNNTMLFMEEF